MKCIFCDTEGGFVNRLNVYYKDRANDYYLAECEMCSAYLEKGDKRFQWQ